MKILSWFIAVFLVSNTALAAQSFSVTAAGKKYALVLVKNRDVQILRSGEHKLHEGSLTHEFVALKSLEGAKQPYLVSVWKKGAHGESVFVHDLASGKELWHINSSWPVDWRVGGGVLTVLYTLDSEKDGRFPRYRVRWSGPDAVVTERSPEG